MNLLLDACKSRNRDLGIFSSAPRRDGSSPLFIASQLGYFDCVKVLLENEAEVDQSRIVSWSKWMWFLVTSETISENLRGLFVANRTIHFELEISPYLSFVVYHEAYLTDVSYAPRIRPKECKKLIMFCSVSCLGWRYAALQSLSQGPSPSRQGVAQAQCKSRSASGTKQIVSFLVWVEVKFVKIIRSRNLWNENSRRYDGVKLLWRSALERDLQIFMVIWVLILRLFDW